MAAEPRVDFYVVEGGLDTGRVACRLAEKAFARGLTVFIRTGSAERTRALDDLLWTFRGTSFLPHAAGADAAEHAPIRLGEDRCGGGAQLLINLADAACEDAGGFERVAEVVGPTPGERKSGRERFRHYRDRLGIEPETHRLKV